MAICNTTACAAVEPDDFNIVWSNSINFKEIIVQSNGTLKIYGPINASVAGQNVKLTSDIANSGIVFGADVWTYVYIDKSGNITTSSQPPRSQGVRQGLYAPGSYKRLIGFYLSGSASIFQPDGSMSSTKIVALSTASIINGAYVFFNTTSACPIASEIQVDFSMPAGSASLEIFDLKNTFSAGGQQISGASAIIPFITSLVKCGFAYIILGTNGTAVLNIARQKTKIS
jgi:hypothetical protein